MQQLFLELWDSLDWPNLIAGPLLALVIGFIVKRLYPAWIRSREGTKFVIQQATKYELEFEFRRVLDFRRDSNLLVIWIVRKSLLIILAGILLVVVTIGFAIAHLSPWLNQIFSLYMPKGMITVTMVFASLFGVLAGGIIGSLSHMRRITGYYTHFAEFRKQACDGLSEELVASIEGKVVETDPSEDLLSNLGSS